MSGGRYDYAYQKVEDMAEQLAESKSPLRRAFAKHLMLVSKAMHDVEWVDSGDYGEGDDAKAIELALGDKSTGLIMKEIVDEAEESLSKLESALQKHKERKV